MAWEKRVWHQGLNKFRVIRAQSQFDVDELAAAQLARWDNDWQRKLSSDRVREAKKLSDERAQEAKRKSFESKHLGALQVASAKNFAQEQTREHEAARELLDTILFKAVRRSAISIWDEKKDGSSFGVYRPQEPIELGRPIEPSRDENRFQKTVIEPHISFLDKLAVLPAKRKVERFENEKLLAEAEVEALFAKAKADWLAEVDLISEKNTTALADFETAIAVWKQDEADFYARRAAQHAEVEDAKLLYLARDSDAVKAYVEDLLRMSGMPETFPSDHKVSYNQDTSTVVLDYELPPPRLIPTVKEVKYVISRSEFQEVTMPEAWSRKFYDATLFKIALSTLHDIFKNDEAQGVTTVVFNGWVRSLDRSTGADVHACIMSLEADKAEFLAINLEHVDPKACFKKLKGVAASKLIELSPVRPLLLLDKNDKASLRVTRWSMR